MTKMETEVLRKDNALLGSILECYECELARMFEIQAKTQHSLDSLTIKNANHELQITKLIAEQVSSELLIEHLQLELNDAKNHLARILERNAIIDQTPLQYESELAFMRSLLSTVRQSHVELSQRYQDALVSKSANATVDIELNTNSRINTLESDSSGTISISELWKHVKNNGTVELSSIANDKAFRDCAITSHTIYGNILETVDHKSVLLHKILNLPTNGRLFELVCCAVFELQNEFKVIHRGKPGDRGIDIELRAMGQRTYSIAVQCKKYNRKQGASDVREFVGSMLAENVHKGILISTSFWTKEAVLAVDVLNTKGFNIVLWSRTELMDKCSSYAPQLISFLDDNSHAGSYADCDRAALSGGAAVVASSFPASSPQQQQQQQQGGSSCALDDLHALSNKSQLVNLSDFTAHQQEFTSINVDVVDCDPEDVSSCSDFDDEDLVNNDDVISKKPTSIALASQSRQFVAGAVSSPRKSSTPNNFNKININTTLIPVPRTAKKMSGGVTDTDWQQAEEQQLARLVHGSLFRDSQGRTEWGAMTEHLAQLTATGHPCAIFEHHFDKEKLRSKWKNIQKRKKAPDNT